MADSTALKLKRASERIDELNTLLREQRPFSYVVQTDIQTGERATLAKKNEAVADEAAAIAGDAVHNIRSALDHTYWEIVSPFAVGPRQERAIQFPFSDNAEAFEKAVKNRLAHQVSDRFFKTVILLGAHAEASGNRLLYLIDRLDIPDKHRELVPVGNYTGLSSDIIRRQVSDFPTGFDNCAFGQNRRDVVWHSSHFDRVSLGDVIPPTLHKFEKKLNVPVEIILSIRELGMLTPMVPTLNKMVEVAANSIKAMRLAAP